MGHHPLAYKKSFIFLSSYWNPFIWSRTFFMIDYFSFIPIDFYISICFRILNLNDVFFSHIRTFVLRFRKDDVKHL